MHWVPPSCKRLQHGRVRWRRDTATGTADGLGEGEAVERESVVYRGRRRGRRADLRSRYRGVYVCVCVCVLYEYV
jgi:hypothetical protein